MAIGAAVRTAGMVVVVSLAACASNATPPSSTARSFDVRAYGATGNGRTDDTGAIRAALAAAESAGGGTIYFPAGIYLIDPALGEFVVDSRMTILGSGAHSILRVRNDAGEYNLIFGQAAHRISNVAFLHLRVDQNPLGNPHSNINPLTDAENVIQLYDFDGITIDDVAFDEEPGIQAVVLAGPRASGATIEHSTFHFHRGASSNPYYDNSSVYTEAARVLIAQNHFVSTNAENAVTAIEVHGGPDIDVAKNEALEFQIGINVVNSTLGNPDVEDAQAVIEENRLLETTQAFDLWSVTGRTLRDVIVRHNRVTMEQHRQYVNTWLGVTFVRGAERSGIDGAFDRVTVEDNVFDFRRLYTEKIATLEAAGIDAEPKGALHRLSVLRNEFLASPATGLRIGAPTQTPQLQEVVVAGNTIADAGWDSHAPARTRAAVLLEPAWLTDVHVDHNSIVDTGRFGDLRRAFSAWAHPLPISANVTLRNDRIIPHGVMQFSVDERIVNTRGTRP
jgi:hypothetical protein